MDQATDLSVFVRHPAGRRRGDGFVVDGVHCGACIVTIEKGLAGERGVRGARVNLASKRVTVEWDDGALGPAEILQRLDRLGYPAYPFSAPAVDSMEAAEERRLLRCLGVAAFGAMNVMLLSVALWAGAASDDNSATRDLFHWFSALVAIPCVAYAGAPFFESAIRALRQRSVNMDVPITIGIVLSIVLSIMQTFEHQRETYFESGVMLLMFLLAGRVLDQRMRRKTRDVATNLAAIKAERATKLTDERRGDRHADRGDPARRPRARARRRARRGRRDRRGRPLRDRPEPRHWRDGADCAEPGAQVYAGSFNLTGALRVRVVKAAAGTLLDEVNALLEKAIERRSSYVKLADRAARLYAPVVHADGVPDLPRLVRARRTIGSRRSSPLFPCSSSLAPARSAWRFPRCRWSRRAQCSGAA